MLFLRFLQPDREDAVPPSPASRGADPPPRLRGFDRVFVKAGETANVELIVPAEDLTTWNTDAHAFTSPGKRARILLGASSQDIRLKKRIRL